MNIPRAAWAQGFRLLFTGAGEYEFKGDLLCIFFFHLKSILVQVKDPESETGQTEATHRKHCS